MFILRLQSSFAKLLMFQQCMLLSLECWFLFITANKWSI